MKTSPSFRHLAGSAGLAGLLLGGGQQVAAQQPPASQPALPATSRLATTADAVVAQVNQQGNKRAASPIPNASVTSLASPYTQVALTAKSGGQEASATLGVRLRSVLLSATLRQPFQDKPARITPLTLDGLGQGASGMLTVQYLPRAEVSAALPALLAQHSKAVQDAFDAVRLKYLQRRGKIGPNASFGELANGKSSNAAEQKLFDETTYQQIASDLTTDELKDLAAAGITAPSPWLAGLSASIGKVQYDYIADLTAQRPSYLAGANRNLRGYVGYILGPKAVLAASYTLQRKYQTATDDPISFYYPLSDASPNTTTSKDVFVGQPALATTSRLSLEFRQLFTFNDKAGTAQPYLAVVPSVHVLTNVQKLALNSAFYFLKVDDAADSLRPGLQGGVALGYLTGPQFDFQSFDSGFSAEVFISVPFSLFNLSQ